LSFLINLLCPARRSKMGSWWRSEDMSYVSLIISEEAAPACVRALGELGCVQFTDLCPELTPFQRRYVVYIRRCDEIERKIRYINGEVKLMGVSVKPAGSIDKFIAHDAGEPVSGAYLLESLETKLDKYEQQLLELNKFSKKLTEEYSHKVSSDYVMF
jgi:V-type H+-transporting ATPase subunit a